MVFRSTSYPEQYPVRNTANDEDIPDPEMWDLDEDIEEPKICVAAIFVLIISVLVVRCLMLQKGSTMSC
jgi:hypothetical protein